MVETCDTCACFPVCDRKFNMFGVFMGWADCNNWIPEVKSGFWVRGNKLNSWKGKWKPSESIWYCSNCNNEAYWDTDYGQQLFDYCPNCGATMCKE